MRLLTALWLAFGAVPPLAQADALSVTRDPGAEDCPDAAAIEQRVLALRKGQALAAEAGYRVHFAGSEEQRSATLSVAGRSGVERVLNARGPSCEALAQATAVTLALLLDAQAEAEVAPVAPVAPSVPPAASAPPPVAAPRDRALTVSLATGALLGVTRTLAPLLSAELGFERGRFRVDLGALGVPVQRLGYAPGSLREWLAAGSLRGCFLPYRAPPFSLGTCAGAYLGVIDVRTRGYARNARRKELWAALPLELFFAYESGPFALQLAAQALLPLRRPDFSIDGLGKAYASWPVAMALVVRLLGRWQEPFASRQKK